MKRLFLIAAILIPSTLAAQQSASVKESKRVFTTYGFSDPNPVAEMTKYYPYYRFDGYTNTPSKKEWTVVELENDFIKVMILPEIGGKIWAAWEKSTGKPFIYYNQVVKFRDVAMRGPWTSGGIEANYGIIGHTPNCATPMDYTTTKNEDGSVSCFIGTLDLLTQTYWSIEVNLPADKAYFTTRSFWSNTTSLEQPYYHWMNVGMPSKGNLQFIYPGTRHIGHVGEYSDWTIEPSNGKDVSYYENNNFGGPKSYHVIGKHSDFFGAFYHDDNFGMARYSLRDDKPGSKIWIWGLSRNGMIWEDLLTDNDGQYVEVQSGRLFNQASDGSNFTPFKQFGFAPHATDEWTEYWFPVKGTKGFVKANPYGALNVRVSRSHVRIDFSPVQKISDELKISDDDKVIYSKKVSLAPLQLFSDSVAFTGNVDNLVVTLGGNALVYKADPRDGVLSRPVDAPKDFDWNSAYGLYTLGKEFIQQRYYPRAKEKLSEALAKEPNYLPALADLSMIALRNLDFAKALEYSRHALSIDTYHPDANFYYGLASKANNNIADAKDGFEIAALSPSHRSAAYAELGILYFKENDLSKAKHYAQKSLRSNSLNLVSLQLLAVIARTEGRNNDAESILRELESMTRLNHFVNFERYRISNSDAAKKTFTGAIRNELPHETYQWLADFYSDLGLLSDAETLLALSPKNTEVLYRLAYVRDLIKSGSGKDVLTEADKSSPLLVFPFRESSAKALTWAITQTNDWKPRYLLGLIYWSRDNHDKAKEMFASAGEPTFAPFYAARAELKKDESYASDIKRAAQLDPGQWRYGKLLAEHLLELKDYPGALKVAQDYQKRFAGDFRIDMLAAKALLLNKQYKASSTLLAKTTILPYEGATDGRQLHREAWLMQAIDQLKAKNHKAALASIEKAKIWPENLGAGRPYDDMLDLRLENYLEALVYEQSKQKDKAQARIEAITSAKSSRRHNALDLITALAYKKAGRSSEGENILKDWKEKQPNSKLAQWAYEAYNGQAVETDLDGNDFRVIKRVISELK
jgi:Tfp pilus assembly protein PilF